MPEPVVEDLRDVAQARQVVLDRLELAHGHARERRVLAVGGEHPRVVRVAGADPAGAVDGAERRGVLVALVEPADLQVLGRAREVEHVLLAPVDGRLQPPVARQREPRARAGALARLDLGRERAGRVAQRGAQLGARVARALVGAGDGDPQRLAVAAVDPHAVAQLPAGALAERPVVARARHLLGGADVAALRAAVSGARPRRRRAGGRTPRRRRSRAASRSGAAGCPARGSAARRPRRPPCRAAGRARAACCRSSTGTRPAARSGRRP